MGKQEQLMQQKLFLQLKLVQLNDFFIEIMKFTREREGKIVKSIESYRILPKEDN